MDSLIVPPVPERKLVPINTYKAVITNMTVSKSEKFGNDQVEIEFELIDFKFEDQPEIKPKLRKFFGFSLYSKSHLVQYFIKPLLDRQLSDEELRHKGFNLRSLLGTECLIQVSHKDREDGSKSNVISYIAKAGGQE